MTTPTTIPIPSLESRILTLEAALAEANSRHSLELGACVDRIIGCEGEVKDLTQVVTALVNHARPSVPGL